MNNVKKTSTVVSRGNFLKKENIPDDIVKNFVSNSSDSIINKVPLIKPEKKDYISLTVKLDRSVFYDFENIIGKINQEELALLKQSGKRKLDKNYVCNLLIQEFIDKNK